MNVSHMFSHSLVLWSSLTRFRSFRRLYSSATAYNVREKRKSCIWTTGSWTFNLKCFSHSPGTWTFPHQVCPALCWACLSDRWCHPFRHTVPYRSWGPSQTLSYTRVAGHQTWSLDTDWLGMKQKGVNMEVHRNMDVVMLFAATYGTCIFSFNAKKMNRINSYLVVI